MDSDRLYNITRADVQVLKLLHKAEFTPCLPSKCERVYLHHESATKWRPWFPPDRVVDGFTCENTAYRRMKLHGLCKAGVIPDFYGQIDELDPKVWAPHLDAFGEDELLPHAIFIEYIPGLKMMDLSTFSEFRLVKLRSILKDIHRCRVLHADTYPRNIMVQEELNRVVWIDFNVSQTYREDVPLTPRQQERIDEENEFVDEFCEFLRKDHELGEIKENWDYYYEYN